MSKAAELAALIGSQTALSNRNLIINGAMQVAQRGTSFSVTDPNSPLQVLDRWAYRRTGTWSNLRFTISQSTGPSAANISDALKIETTTVEGNAPNSGEGACLAQAIERQNTQHIAFGTSNAKPYTISFWVKSSIAGTFYLNPNINHYDKGISKGYTINSANTWEYKSVSFPALTSGTDNNTAPNSAGMHIFWVLDAVNTSSGSEGSYRDSGSGNDSNIFLPVGASNTGFTNTANATFEISGVQLEVGEQATPFEHRSFADEFAKCKRYYQRWDATASDSTSNKPIGAGVWNGTGQVLASFTYDEMRVSPTFTASSTDFVKAYGGGFADARTGGNGLDTIGTKSARFNFTTSTSRTAGHGTMIQMHNDGEFLELDAEL
jgi:hypothetical protein